MANGRLSRLNVLSDILQEEGKRRLSNARVESKIPMGDLDSKKTDVEARTIDEKVIADVFSMSNNNLDGSSGDRHAIFKCVSLDTLDIICKVLGEFVGTAMLLLFACMGLLTWNHGQPDFVGGLVFGLTILFIIQVVGAVSGSHINPAVTLAALIYGKIKPLLACMYVAAQFCGALVGFGVLKAMTPISIFSPAGAQRGVCSPSPHASMSEGQVFFYEYVGTTILIALCCAAWDPRHAKNQDSMAIKFGLSLSVPFIAVSPATGCCINPARAFAPALYNGDWHTHWAYWLAPLLAATVTSVVYKFLFYRESPEKKDS